MLIYIDESGSFVPSTTADSWNVIAALVAPEHARRQAERLLRDLKVSTGRVYTDEVKLKDLTESQLIAFLFKLRDLDSTVYASCIDLGAQDARAIAEHKRNQVERILVNRPRMIHPEGRALIEDLANRVERLSPQLYTQLVVQIDLLDQVYRSSLLYYSQRTPATLGSFRWRIDEKNSSRPFFEEVMRHMAPPLLQSRSLVEPALFVDGFDYTHFDRAFAYGLGEIPTYLEEETGIQIKSAAHLGKVLKDFAFVRSHDLPGVQIADLLATTFRRVLRGEFRDNRAVAGVLGSLMVQRAKPDPPIHLITMSASEQHASGHVYDVANITKATARSMLKERRPAKSNLGRRRVPPAT